MRRAAGIKDERSELLKDLKAVWSAANLMKNPCGEADHAPSR